jgi:TRAP-type C4-dicarboxylate transport system substrate-binding protein
MNQPRKIRWLIAHQPQELFVRTATAFAEELNKYCAGDLEIEILTYSDYVEKYNEIAGLENMKHRGDDEETFEAGMTAFWNALFESQIEMSQMQVGRIAGLYYDFNALDLPFLFEDHDHVQRVVEGPVGQKLCAELGRKSGITGLAFTYSGGYRVIGSHDPICTLAELKNKCIAVQQPLSLGTTIEDMGGKYIVSGPGLWHKDDPIKSGKADVVETTYLRFNEINGKHVLKSNHSMFMTTIVVSNKFWATLTESQQDAFRKAGLAASRKERQWSIEDAAKFEADAVKNGVTIRDMSLADTEELKHKSQLTYVKSQKYFEDKEIVRQIVKQRLH